MQAGKSKHRTLPQIVGLDELETWVTTEAELRHLYFPTIFGEPRFNLKVKLSLGFAAYSYGDKFDLDAKNAIDLFQISALNVGAVPSYVSSISFIAIVDGERQQLHLLNFGDPIMGRNPKPGTAIEPGRQLTWHFPYEALRQMKKQGKDVFPVEVLVYDEIGNTYSATIPESIRSQVFS